MAKEDFKQKAKKEFQELGETKFEIQLSNQAGTIISAMEEKFPMEHFKKWWLKHYAFVNGGQLHHYFCAPDGIQEATIVKEE